MIRVRMGEVLAVGTQHEGITEVRVAVDGAEEHAVNYDALTGSIAQGDTVVLNTTAVHLGLGTGGQHFVMGIVGRETAFDGPGHIVKGRYAPHQVTVLSVEEPDSPHHAEMVDGDLEGTPVIAASLHSVIAAAALTARALLPSGRIVYVMTDGAALPAPFSHLLRYLQGDGLVDHVVTCGHAYGGDSEAVTLHSGLLAARSVHHADIIIAAMGPGVVGTETRWGTTAIEQGIILDAAATLGGRSIAVPRLSFADPRPRHRGLSHHTLTALGRVAHRPCDVALPQLTGERRQHVVAQLTESGIATRHRVHWHREAWQVIAALEALPFRISTMGRTPNEDPEPFASAAAAVYCALAPHTPTQS